MIEPYHKARLSVKHLTIMIPGSHISKLLSVYVCEIIKVRHESRILKHKKEGLQYTWTFLRLYNMTFINFLGIPYIAWVTNNDSSWYIRTSVSALGWKHPTIISERPVKTGGTDDYEEHHRLPTPAWYLMMPNNMFFLTHQRVIGVVWLAKRRQACYVMNLYLCV